MELIVHPLVLPVIVPFAAGVVCLLLPRAAERVRPWFTVLVAAACLWLVWPLFTAADARLELGAWLSLKVDALSAFVLLAAAAFGLLIAVYSLGWMRGRAHHRSYFATLLWTLSAAFGAVLANDLIVFLVCWGFLALTLYLMIGIAGPGAAGAARKSLVIVGGADALLLLGTVLLWTLSGTLRMDAAAVTLNGTHAYLALLCFVAAAFAKAGAVPLHTWVPDCGERADAPVSAFLPASLDKLLGIYLFARVCRDLFELTPGMLVVLMLLGALTILAAVMMALVQHDLKRLLAYHAVSQVGYMVLGIASGTAVGLAGGLFHMLNHAVYKCALFLSAGAVEQAAGSTDLDRLGGLSRTMPVTFAACTIAALSISGIPPLNGFASKWMVYQGIIDAAATVGPVWIVCLVAAMLGSALTLASFVKVLHATFLCKPSPNVTARRVTEAGVTMLLPMILLATVCVVFGVFASAVPLRWLILPAAPAESVGVWWSGPATTLMLAAIAAGAIIYLLTMRSGRLRRVETYIGGEHLDEVTIRGEAPGKDRHVEVTGVDFYDTVEQLAGLRRIYALSRRGIFDIYQGTGRIVASLVTMLRGAHSGLLSLYLLWFMAGLVGVVYCPHPQWGGVMIEVVAVLILLMIVAALFVVETANLLSSVISVGAVGFLAAIVFLFLGAPDVAIVQIGVEVVSLVILIRATIGREEAAAVGARSLAGTVVAVALIAATALFGMWSLLEFPPFGHAVMDRIAAAPSNLYLEEGLQSTGAPNIVTAVLLDFRAYDTLGEATVLFCAVLGALTVLRRRTQAASADQEAPGNE